MENRIKRIKKGLVVYDKLLKVQKELRAIASDKAAIAEITGDCPTLDEAGKLLDIAISVAESNTALMLMLEEGVL